MEGVRWWGRGEFGQQRGEVLGGDTGQVLLVRGARRPQPLQEPDVAPPRGHAQRHAGAARRLAHRQHCAPDMAQLGH